MTETQKNLANNPLVQTLNVARNTSLRPISTAPKDGTLILLYFAETAASLGPLCCTGWWFKSPKEVDDGWETPFGSIGEPTHWSYHPSLAATSIKG
jgi:hypothetical protein